jgi:hypothetical protein
MSCGERAFPVGFPSSVPSMYPGVTVAIQGSNDESYRGVCILKTPGPGIPRHARPPSTRTAASGNTRAATRLTRLLCSTGVRYIDTPPCRGARCVRLACPTGRVACVCREWNEAVQLGDSMEVRRLPRLS